MNMLLRIFAGLIDGLQFLFFVAFIALQALTPVGGGAAGAATGAYFCWDASSGVFEGVLEAAKCAAGGGIVGGALSAFAIPLGMAIDVAISVSLGGALLLFLATRGMFYPGTVLKALMGEVLPVFAFLPFWSYLVHACIKRHKQGTLGGTVGAAVAFAFGSQGGQGIVNATNLALAQTRNPKEALRRFSDIKPPKTASSNEPEPYAQTA